MGKHLEVNEHEANLLAQNEAAKQDLELNISNVVTELLNQLCEVTKVVSKLVEDVNTLKQEVHNLKPKQ